MLMKCVHISDTRGDVEKWRSAVQQAQQEVILLKAQNQQLQESCVGYKVMEEQV